MTQRLPVQKCLFGCEIYGCECNVLRDGGSGSFLVLADSLIIKLAQIKPCTLRLHCQGGYSYIPSGTFSTVKYMVKKSHAFFK